MIKNNYDDFLVDKKVLMKLNVFKLFGINIVFGVVVNVLKLNVVIVVCLLIGEDDGFIVFVYKIIVMEFILGYQVMVCIEKIGLFNIGYYFKFLICVVIDFSFLFVVFVRKYFNVSNGILGLVINVVFFFVGVGICNEEIILGKFRLQCDKVQKGDEGCNYVDFYDVY